MPNDTSRIGVHTPTYRTNTEVKHGPQAQSGELVSSMSHLLPEYGTWSDEAGGSSRRSDMFLGLVRLERYPLLPTYPDPSPRPLSRVTPPLLTRLLTYSTVLTAPVFREVYTVHDPGPVCTLSWSFLRHPCFETWIVYSLCSTCGL